jgi:hypothetical protein
MNRPGLFLLLAALPVLGFSACTDEPTPTGPSDAAPPFLGTAPFDGKVDLLIEELYPAPGLLNSAQHHWTNIQRQLRRDPAAAREQARLMVSDAEALLAEGQLLDPDHEDLPVSTAADGVRLLAYYLYSYTVQDLPSLDPSFYDSPDKAIQWVNPSVAGDVTTENGWGRMSWEDGAGDNEEVLITISLIDNETCDPADGLKTSVGCWDFDQYGGGAFERTVEICVADPGPPPEGLTDSEYFVELRVHQQDEITLEVNALPYVAATLDCTDFVGYEPAPEGPAENRSVLGSIGAVAADLLLPDPLRALFREDRRPARGIGGLTGSFTWEFGAVPEEGEEDITEIPESPGPLASSWAIVAPSTATYLCNADPIEPNDCPTESVDHVDITALATTGTSPVDPPFEEVYFYYVPSGEVEPATLIGSTDVYTHPGGDGDQWSWTVSLDWSDVSDTGPIDVYAVGAVDPGATSGGPFRTGVNSWIRVVDAAAPVTASVVIQSVTTWPGGIPANLAGVEGPIEVTLWVDPGENHLSEVGLYLGGEQVGVLSLGEWGPEGPFEVAFVVNTAQYETPAEFGSQIDGQFPNGSYTLLAEAVLVAAEAPSVSSSLSLTLANPDTFVGEVTPDATALGTNGHTYWKSPYLVEVSPVVYSGKTVISVTVAYQTNLVTGPTPVEVGTLTDGSAPFSVTFGYGSGSALEGYQTPSAELGWEQVAVTGGIYSDASPVNPGSLPVPLRSGLTTDNVPPYMNDGALFTLPQQVSDEGRNPSCCANNWVAADYEFLTGMGDWLDNHDGVDDGVSANVVASYRFAPSSGWPSTAPGRHALPAVDTPGESGASPSLVNTAFRATAFLTDRLGNWSEVPFTPSPPDNSLNTFGLDAQDPTDQALLPGSQFTHAIYNLANPGTGLPMSFSAVEDRAGFSITPLRMRVLRLTTGNTIRYPVGAGFTEGGYVNEMTVLPACGTAAIDPPANTTPCVPDGTTTTDAYYWVMGHILDQAGNEADEDIVVKVLQDQTAPVAAGLLAPEGVPLVGGQVTPFDYLAADNLDLWSVDLGFDHELTPDSESGVGTGVVIPFSAPVLNDGDRWDLEVVSGTGGTVSFPFVRSLELTTALNQPEGPGTVRETTRFWLVARDAAGNLSLPAAQDLDPGYITTPSTLTYAPPANLMDSIVIRQPASAVNLCNGRGPSDCPETAAGASSLTLKIQAMGGGGVFPNPFAPGTVHVYLVTDATTPAPYYASTNGFSLLGAVGGGSATITDTGAVRTYTWTFTLTSAMVATIPPGTPVSIAAVGVNNTGDAILTRYNANVTVVGGG